MCRLPEDKALLRLLHHGRERRRLHPLHNRELRLAPFLQWALLLWLVTACTSGQDTPVPAADTWFLAAADTAGVVVPEALADFCRPGPSFTAVTPGMEPPPQPQRNPAAERAIDAVPIMLAGAPNPDRLRCVFRSTATWRAFWGGRAPPVAVDFDQQTLIAAAMGEQATTGYEIVIDSVLSAGDSLLVVVRQIEPRTCEVSPMTTSPIYVVGIPRTEQSVHFIERITRPEPCSP